MLRPVVDYVIGGGRRRLIEDGAVVALLATRLFKFVSLFLDDSARGAKLVVEAEDFSLLVPEVLFRLEHLLVVRFRSLSLRLLTEEISKCPNLIILVIDGGNESRVFNAQAVDDLFLSGEAVFDKFKFFGVGERVL